MVSLAGPAPGQPAPPAAMDNGHSDDQASAREAAVQGLREMLAIYGKALAPGSLPARFPFKVQDLASLGQATIGQGLEIRAIDPRRLLAGRGALPGMAEPTGLWDFLVLVADRPVGLMEVGARDGQWQVLGAGGAELAAEVHAQARRGAPGGTLRLFRSYEAVVDLLELQDGQQRSRYAPLAGARKRLFLSRPEAGQALAEERDLIPGLQALVRASAFDPH